MICLSVKDKIEMNNGQMGLILPETSILGKTEKNITEYGNQMCKYWEHFSTTYAKKLKFRLLKETP